MKELKSKVIEKLNAIVADRINTAESAIQSAKESKNNETKSTAGDKFETGRAMMQLEQEKNELQLAKAQHAKALLRQAENASHEKSVGFGSLVFTNQGIYFLAIGIGKVNVEEEIIFAISPEAPVGKLLLGKTIGSQIDFRGKRIEIFKSI